ncbi:MAG: hypothetical protein KatS3mg119_1593 [Rhodothalassiaceae bacterium]|nr:MAG: hypothetical protein KatS3mg119_1593 [Rhodothalassiaceae bacterium]
MSLKPQFVTFSERGLKSPAAARRLVRVAYRAWREGRQTIALIRTTMREIETIIAGFTDIGIPTTTLTPAAVVSRPARHVREALAAGAGVVVLPLSGGPYWQEQVVGALRYSLDLPAPRDLDRDGAGGLDAPAPAAPVKVALLGCGAVGSAVLAALLDEPRHVAVAAVMARDLARHRARFPGVRFVRTLDELAAASPDIFIDLGSREAPSEEAMRRFLTAGVPVITANKQVLAASFDALRDAARRGSAALLHSAAVGGSAPVLELARRLAGDGITAVSGIVNGTVNFVLSRLADGASFEEALDAARAAGLAEADPSDDLEGHDAAAKAVLVAHAAFGQAPDAAPGRETLGEALARLPDAVRAGRVKQVTEVRRTPDGRIEASVRFLALPDGHALLRCRDAENAAEVRLADGSRHAVFGLGAGGVPTAAAVLADLEDLLIARAGAAAAPRAVANG